MAVLELELGLEQILTLARQLNKEQQRELMVRLSRPGEETFVTPTLPPQPRVPGRSEGKIWIAPDFNAPLPEEIQALFEK